MRRLAAALGILVALTACTATGDEKPGQPERATVTQTTTVDDRTRDLTVDSPALGTTAKVRILLPAGYDADKDNRWPVLYLLHGCCDTYDSWTRSTDVEELAQGVIVVMPEGGAAGFYSDWRSGPRWETFHLKELTGILEREFRASDVRAVAGLSMGGYGALGYTVRNPGFFVAAASFSGIVHPSIDRRTVDGYRGLIQSEGEDPDGLFGAGPTGWREHDPYVLAAKFAGTPLFLSCGDGRPGPLDRPGTAPNQIEQSLLPQNTALAARLKQLGIPVTTDFYGAGTHDWPYWQRELHRAWPMLEQALGLT